MIMENGQRTLILQPKISLGHSQFRTLSEGQEAEGTEGGKCFIKDRGGNIYSGIFKHLYSIQQSWS